MDKMKLYEAALSYHVTGRLVESVADDVKNAPFDGAKPAAKDRKDQYGNKVKNVAKHLAKKGLKSVSEESIADILEALEDIDEASMFLSPGRQPTQMAKKQRLPQSNAGKPSGKKKDLSNIKLGSANEETILELLDTLESCYEDAMEIQDALEESGVDLEELFAITEDLEEVEESFAKMSKTKQLIARRRAGRSKKLTAGYHQANKRHAPKKAKSIQKK